MYKSKKYLLLVALCGLSGLSMAQNSQIELFPRENIRISEGMFKNAEEVDTRYILSLNPDKLLAPYLREAGLQPKADSYGNWENTGLDGHIGGHYLSALASMYAATSNEELKQRLTYMLAELKKCQDKLGTGYLGGVPNSAELWGEIASGKIDAQTFSLNKRWVPWYNIHKMYAGLYDAYHYAHIPEAKDMLIKLADWWLAISKNLSDEQIEYMLKAEFGGMNEAFANVYKLSPDAKYLHEARRFAHKAILNPLLAQEDKLTGLHANTQIPKVIGYQQIALLSGDEKLMQASDFFWNNVVSSRSVAIGGNSVREHFHDVRDYSEMLLSKEGPETCNTYNMLKLSKLLYSADPSSHYIDFYERATYNHILSTQHPDKGGFVYFTPMRPQHYRNYSQAQEGFWCCVGSGLENHSKYGELTYAYKDATLFVNLFMPSIVSWQEMGVRIEQHTSFPYEEASSLTILTKKKKTFTLAIRQPSWLAKGMEIQVNGKRFTDYQVKDNYVHIHRKWKNSDVVSFSLPMELAVESLPDKSSWVAFRYGPIVLAAERENLKGDNYFADGSRMGHIANGELIPIDATPVVSFDTSSVQQHVHKLEGNDLHFAMSLPGQSDKLVLKPFYNIHEKRYILYWPLPATGQSAIEEREKALQLIEKTSVDRITLGEQQPESDHGFTYSNSQSALLGDVHWRNTTDFIAYNLNNKKGEGRSLVIRYIADKQTRKFKVFFNHELKQIVETEPAEGHPIKTVVIALDADKMKELKDTALPVRIEAIDGQETAKFIELRLSKEQ